MIYSQEEFLLLIENKMKKRTRKKRNVRTGEKSRRLNPLASTVKPTIRFDSSPPQDLGRIDHQQQTNFIEKIPKDAIKPVSPEPNNELLTEGVATIIFAGSTDTVGTPEPTLENPQAEGNKEDEGKHISLTAETRQYKLKRQAQLQIALNIFKALNNRKLQTLDRNALTHVQSYLPPGASEEDAKKFMLEAIDDGLAYWNRNIWDLPKDPSAIQIELVETCIDLRRTRNAQERAKQQILTYFSLI